jgi:hypothetical protein
VPTKLQEFKDSECLVIVDHVLDQAVASRRPGQATEAIAELRKIKQGIQSNTLSATAQSPLPPSTEKEELVKQAVLRTGQ